MKSFQTNRLLQSSLVLVFFSACTSPLPSQVKTLIDSKTALVDTIPVGGTLREPLVFPDDSINEMQLALLPANNNYGTQPQITSGPQAAAMASLNGNWQLSELDCWNVSNNSLVVIPAATAGGADTYVGTLVALGNNFTLTVSIGNGGAVFTYASNGCNATFPLSATFPATDQVNFTVGTPTSNPPNCVNSMGTAMLTSKLGTPISNILQGTFYYTISNGKALLTRTSPGMGLCASMKSVNGSDVLYFNKR